MNNQNLLYRYVKSSIQLILYCSNLMVGAAQVAERAGLLWGPQASRGQVFRRIQPGTRGTTD